MDRRDFLSSVVSASLLPILKPKDDTITTSSFNASWREDGTKGILAPPDTPVAEFYNYDEWRKATTRLYHREYDYNYDMPSKNFLFNLEIKSLYSDGFGQSWYSHPDIEDFDIMFRHFPDQSKYVATVYAPKPDNLIFYSRSDMINEVRERRHYIVSEFIEEEYGFEYNRNPDSEYEVEVEFTDSNDDILLAKANSLEEIECELSWRGLIF